MTTEFNTLRNVRSNVGKALDDREKLLNSAAKLGADVATMPYKIFQQLFKHPLTDLGIDAFNRDWAKVMERRKANARR
jgi:transaldolase